MRWVLAVSFSASNLTPGELRVAVTENIQTFSPTERALLQKLDCSIDNAFLEAQEFALYSVLGILLGMYADSFAVWEGPDSRAFVHATPQDTLTGVARIRLNSKRRSFRTIPDATVRITRLYRDLEKKAHHLVLVIEAKRLVGSHGSLCSICHHVFGVVMYISCHYRDTMELQ